MIPLTHKLERDTVRENLAIKFPERDFPPFLLPIRIQLLRALDALDAKDAEPQPKLLELADLEHARRFAIQVMAHLERNDTEYDDFAKALKYASALAKLLEDRLDAQRLTEANAQSSPLSATELGDHLSHDE